MSNDVLYIDGWKFKPTDYGVTIHLTQLAPGKNQGENGHPVTSVGMTYEALKVFHKELGALLEETV